MTEDPGEDKAAGQLETTTNASSYYTAEPQQPTTSKATVATTAGVPGGMVRQVEAAFSTGHLAWTLVNVIGTILLVALVVLRFRRSALCKKCAKGQSGTECELRMREMPAPLAQPEDIPVETLSSSLESVELFVAPLPRRPLRQRRTPEKEV